MCTVAWVNIGGTMEASLPATPPISPLAGAGLSFRTQLELGMCGHVLLTGAAITWLAHRSAGQSTVVLTATVFREASAHAVDDTRAFMQQAAPVVETLRRFGVENLAVNDTDKL